MVRFAGGIGLGLALAATGGCNERSSPAVTQTADVPASSHAPAWPASLHALAGGYPTDKSPCRRVGETPATAEYLSDAEFLVACPGPPNGTPSKAITAKSGLVVGEVDGFSLISIPLSQLGGAALESASPTREGDALVPGTKFNATGDIPCARYAGQPTTACKFGVVRSTDGTATLSVFRPGGGSRMIYFDAKGKATGFDANQADGSAGSSLKVSRNEDLNFISIGDERYEVPEVVIMGD